MLVPVLEIFMPPDVCLKRVYLLTYLLHPLETPEALSSQPVSMVIVVMCVCFCVCRVSAFSPLYLPNALMHFKAKANSAFYPPGSVNEYQLRLGRQRQVWFVRY